MEEKQKYEEPEITKVEFDFEEVLTASACEVDNGTFDYFAGSPCYD